MNKQRLKRVFGLAGTVALLTGVLIYLFFAQNSFTWLTHSGNVNATYQMGLINLSGGLASAGFDVPLGFKAATQLRTSAAANDSNFNDCVVSIAAAVKNAGNVNLNLYCEITPESGKTNPGLMYYVTKDAPGTAPGNRPDFAALLKSKNGGDSLNNAADLTALLNRENAVLTEPAAGVTPAVTPVSLAPGEEINLNWAFWLDYEKALADTPSGACPGKSVLQESYDSSLYMVLDNDYGIHLKVYAKQKDYYQN